MLKSDIVAPTCIGLETMLPGAETCTVPPLNACELPVVLPVGVTTMVTVAVEPACKDGRLQLTIAFVLPPPHVPELEVAELNVSGTPVTAELRLSVTVMLFARSGPLLVTM